MGYLEKVSEIEKEIINSLRVAVDNAKNNSISLVGLYYTYEYVALSIGWRGDLVLVDSDGNYYKVTILSLIELAKLADWVLSQNK